MNKKRLVLIADDEQDTREILEVLLTEAGYNVISAYDGVDTMDKINNQHPDLVILDIMMPLIDGLEVCRRIKGEQSTRDIKVIMLSAADEKGFIQSAEKSGADDYMVKPFESRELLSKVARFYQ